MSKKVYEFNPGVKSWKMYTNIITNKVVDDNDNDNDDLKDDLILQNTNNGKKIIFKEKKKIINSITNVESYEDASYILEDFALLNNDVSFANLDISGEVKINGSLAQHFTTPELENSIAYYLHLTDGVNDLVNQDQVLTKFTLKDLIDKNTARIDNLEASNNKIFSDFYYYHPPRPEEVENNS